MASHFYAMLSRMKNIARWGLMRSTRPETLCEHSLETAEIAHALAVIRNRRFGGSVDANAVAAAAMYHDASEILTGDLPTPIKYYNPEIRTAYHRVETVARERLLSLLPEDLRDDFVPLFTPDEETERLVKAADKISALIKCVEEGAAGNPEFRAAERATRQAIADMALAEADVFLEEFLGSFSLPLDEQGPAVD